MEKHGCFRWVDAVHRREERLRYRFYRRRSESNDECTGQRVNSEQLTILAETSLPVGIRPSDIFPSVCCQGETSDHAMKPEGTQDMSTP